MHASAVPTRNPVRNAIPFVRGRLIRIVLSFSLEVEIDGMCVEPLAAPGLTPGRLQTPIDETGLEALKPDLRLHA